MAGSHLKLYVDRRSQPCRAILIFCSMNNIAFQEISVDVGSGETKGPQFRELFPFAGVPAMDDGGFKLNESYAIFRYLAKTRNVADHWYPQDSKRRALIDRILDWHHLNFRSFSAPIVIHRGFAKHFNASGMFPQADEKVAVSSEKMLKQSCNNLETYMLQTTGKFLEGADKVSIADLSLVCELTQLECLPKDVHKTLFDSRDRVPAWMDAVMDVANPHFDHVHAEFRGSLVKYCQELHAMEGGKEVVHPIDNLEA